MLSGLFKGFLMGLLAVVVGFFIKRNKKWKQENIKQCKSDLKKEKQISDKFEKTLDNTERKEGEDSISYLARCMRESEEKDRE